MLKIENVQHSPMSGLMRPQKPVHVVLKSDEDFCRFQRVAYMFENIKLTVTELDDSWQPDQNQKNILSIAAASTVVIVRQQHPCSIVIGSHVQDVPLPRNKSLPS